MCHMCHVHVRTLINIGITEASLATTDLCCLGGALGHAAIAPCTLVGHFALGLAANAGRVINNLC